MRRAHSFHYREIIITCILIVSVGTVCFLWLNDSSERASNKAVTDMSQMYMQELCAQKIGHIQTSLDSQFAALDMIVESLTKDDLASEACLEVFLARVQEKNKFSFVALVDDMGSYHSTAGIYPLGSKISSFGALLSGERLISYDEFITGDDMLLLGKDISPIQYGNRTFFAIVAGYDRNNMSDVLTISADNIKAHTKIYEADGRMIAECAHEENVYLGNNLFSGLKKYAAFYGDDSVEAIQQGFQEDGEGLVLCDIQGATYYLYYAPVENVDWYVVVVLPYSSMDQAINRFAQTLKWDAVVLVCVVVLLLLMGFGVYAVGMRRAARETEQARQQAEQASQAKSEFLSHMSHDIRTPINGIIGMTNIATKNIDNREKVSDCIQKISEASGHLLMLVNDVLDMSRIESGKIVIAHDPMDMHVLIQSCATIINGQLMSRQLNFACVFGEFAHPCLFGDELHLRQILINILGNAVKFTGDGGTIWFRVEERDEPDGKARYRFEIEDNGIGMSEEFQGRIFEAFSQEENGSRTHYAGTGLGMAITKQFVDLMGGTIQVTSQVGVGSKFTVELTFDIDQSRQGIEEADEETGSTNIAGMNILLVEDNELNLEIAQEILEAEGANITVAMNGQEALDRFLAAPAGSFDVILMDVMMPVMNGYDATRAIRSSGHPDGADIPIVAMTANAYEEDVKEALSSGMNAHVAKPIDIGQFFTVLGQFKKQV
jgi:signal transduction histidine kinase/ActR/RegA family two-component response regulator